VREEETGNRAAGLMPDFFPEKTAPAFYSPGVYASHTSKLDAAEDLFSIRKYLLRRNHLE